MKAILISITAVLFAAMAFGQESDSLYSFFVAGHTYGKPGVNNVGFHPPFKKKFDYLQGRSEIAFGVLTGDIVSSFPIAQDWDEIDDDLDSLGIPVHFAVGNHDMENRDLFEQRYGATYYQFTFKNDLFIILDPNIDSWSISGDQLDFLQKTIDVHAASSNNIFVFFHQILWRENDNLFHYIKYNSAAGRGYSTNFWSEVVPLFQKTGHPVYMFAGDLGAQWSTHVTYDIYDNIRLIASGMGDSPGENFIVVNVKVDGSLNYDLICLRETNPHCLGELTDHLVVHEERFSVTPDVFPNPATNIITVTLDEPSNSTLQLFNAHGALVYEEKVEQEKEFVVNVEALTPGLYLGSVFNTVSQSRFKVIVQ